MAQLEFNIKANFDQIRLAKQELERLRGELLKTSRATDKSVVQDLTDKYAEQKRKVTELSEAMDRYAMVTSSDYAKKMQSLTREVYAFELQADSSRRKIEKLSNEIAKMESKMRRGGLDVGTSAILSDNISSGYASLKDEKARLENLTGLGKQARQELQNMQTEYAKYSGSVSPAKDMTNQMTNAFAQMIAEMKQAPTVGEGISSLFGRLNGDARQLAMSLVGGLGFEQLAEHIFNVRSQFQQLEISFTTMLGSEQKAGALMNQLVQTAAKTPFDMSSITNGAKQLLAYGTAANEVNDILVHLGDISAGLSVPLNDLVYLYGTTMSQGRMYTMDLRQFMGRGIPMAEELGKIMGKTTQEVQQAVTDGKVGADLVKKAIINMTEEGGKFGGLMEKQSTTLQGKWSNIGDSVDQMFNELGKKSQGIFGTGLDLISSLVDNWETVVKVIGSAAVAVGTYKAGLMAAASIQKVQNTMTMASITEELNAKLGQARDDENNFRSLNGKDTKQYRSNRYKALGEAISDTENIGDDEVEKNISRQIEMAKNEGLITEQMAKQLELKREQLVAQQKLADQERMEYENAKRAKEQEEEKARAAKADAEEMARINKANSPQGKIDAKITNLEAQNEAAKNEKELAEEATRAAREKVAAIDAQIEKQKELVEVQKQNVVDVAMSKSVGGYDDDFSDDTAVERENALMGEQLRKLDELKQSRHDAANELYSASVKEREATEAYKDVHEQLKDAYAEEDELRNQNVSSMEVESTAQGANSTTTQTNTTSKEANSIAEGTNATSKNANASATASDTMANVANTTSTSSNTTANTANTVATNVNASAKQRNSFVTGMMSVGTKAATLAQSAFSWATNALTTSLRSLWAAMLANPLTTIVTLVSTAISVFSMFGDETEDVATKAINLGNKASEASAKVRALFAILGDGKDAESHKDTIDALKSAYEEYGVKLDKTIMKSENEASKVQELIKHKEDLIGVIEEQTIAMEHQNAVQQIYDTYKNEKDKAKTNFINATDGVLTKEQAGMATMVVSQEDLDKMAKLQDEIDGLDEGTNKFKETLAKLRLVSGNVYKDIEAYYLNLGLTKEQISEITAETYSYIAASTRANVNKQKSLEMEDKTRAAAEKTRDAIKKLSGSTKENTERNRLAKKSFKEMAVEMDEIRKICERTYHMKIKVDYDDKSLPAWIKNMSQSQRARSARARLAWLKTHKPGDTTKKFGGTNKNYWTIYNENRGLQYKGEKVESTPTETEAQRKKRPAAEAKKKRAAERAAAKAEREQTQKETQEGNRRKATEEYANTISSYSEKAEEDLQNRSLKAMNDGYQKEIEQIKQNDEKEKKAIEDGIDKLVEARKKKEQTIWVNSEKNRKANMWKAPKTDAQYREEIMGEKMVGKDGKALDTTIGENYQKRIQQINDATSKSMNESWIKQSQSLYDYLKDYGTFEEQKLAIAREYEQKIAEVQASNDQKDSKDWKMKSLQQEEKKATDTVEANAVMQKIDWYQVFGNVGGIMKSSLVPLLDELKTFVGTDKFQSLGADQQKAIVEAMGNLRSQIGNTGDLGWKDLAKDLTAYQTALQEARKAQEEYTKLETDLLPKINATKEKLNNAKKMGNTEEQGMLQKELDIYVNGLAKSGNGVVDANNKVRTSGQKLSQTTISVTKPITSITEFLQNSGLSTLQEVWAAFDQLKGGIDGLKALKDAASGAKDLSDAVSDAAGDTSEIADKVSDGLGEGLSKAGLIGQIVAAILKILDILKDGIGTLISNLIDTILQAINGLLKNILSGKFIEQIVSSLVSGIGGILDTVLGAVGSVLSFGALSSAGPSSWFTNSNGKEVKETIDRLTDRNEILTDAIDGLTEELSKTSGFKAIETAKQAEDLQKEKENNLREIMAAQMGYHGSHHSFNYYWGGFSQKQIAEVSKRMGRSWSGDLSDIQNANEAKIILESPDLVQAIKNTGKGGYGNSVYEKLKDYAAEAGELEKITDELKQSLTQTTFDSMKSDFISNLMDMKKSAKEFSNDFTTMLTQSMLNFALSDLMEEKMKPLYEDWANTMKEQGQLSKSDIEKYKAQYDELTKEGMAIRDNIADITGYKQSYEQSASSGAFESMSQDTGDELNGRFTAVQIATEGTYQVVQSIDQKLGQMLSLDGDAKDGSLDFEESTLGMIDLVNKSRLLSGRNSLEYDSGMSTEELADFINGKRVGLLRNQYLPQADTPQIVNGSQSTRSDSLLTADLSLMSQNVGNIYVAVDEGRTILAQSLMCLQSIDERQESWHKPMLRAFERIDRIADKVDRL